MSTTVCNQEWGGQWRWFVGELIAIGWDERAQASEPDLKGCQDL